MKTNFKIHCLYIEVLLYCVKGVPIRRFFWSVFFRIPIEYGKIPTRKNLYTFHTLFYCFLRTSKSYQFLQNPSQLLLMEIVLGKGKLLDDCFYTCLYWLQDMLTIVYKNLFFFDFFMKDVYRNDVYRKDV